MSLRLGLIGNNISYSLSPRIFEWGLRFAGLQGSYTLLDIAPTEFDEFCRSELRRFDGLNVTIPYKLRARELCTELTPTSIATGAVNVLSIRRDTIKGFNTDIGGLRFALGMLVGDLNITSILIIGGGGAARAVIFTASELYRKAAITVATRRRVSELGASHSVIHFTTLEALGGDLTSFNLIVQCTPVGSTNMPGFPTLLPPKFDSKSVVLDLIYAPRQTDFIKCAAVAGARVANGMTMLLGQAAEAFHEWTGETFPLSAAHVEFSEFINLT